MTASDYLGPLLITVAYVLLYYVYMVVVVLRTKSRLVREYEARGERFDRYFGNDREMLAADRVQLNMLEHMPPFLVLLWLHAVFVSTTSATAAGALYLVSRLAYPFALGPRVGRGVRALVLTATVPGYIVIAWLAGGLLWAALGA
jgi:uncharacterized membrane protein YecN with MAPEG domain